MLILSRAALLQGAPLARAPHPTSTGQTSCYRCHLAWQHPGKPSWVFIIKSRLPTCGFPKAVATAHPLWEGTLLPPGQMRRPRAPFQKVGWRQYLMRHPPHPASPARAAPTRAPAFASIFQLASKRKKLRKLCLLLRKPSQKSHTPFPLRFHWPESSHMDIADYREDGNVVLYVS